MSALVLQHDNNLPSITPNDQGGVRTNLYFVQEPFEDPVNRRCFSLLETKEHQIFLLYHNGNPMT